MRGGVFTRHPRLTGAIVALTAGALALAAAEWGLERRGGAKPPVRRSIRLREPPPLFDGYRVASKRETLRQEHLIIDGVEEKAYRYRTDSNGFIEPSHPHEHPELTLAFLGGSTTECAVVEEESRFPHRAGVLLGQRLGLRVNSLNAGYMANNTAHAINILYNKVLPQRPDVALLMENVNDLNIMLFAGGYWRGGGSRSLIATEDDGRNRWRSVTDLLRVSLFPALAQRVGRLLPAPRQDDFSERRKRRLPSLDRVDRDGFARNLSTFVAICRAQGILPVLMTQASRLADPPDEVTRQNMERFEKDWGIGYATYRDLHDSFNGVIRDVARKESVALVDLAAAIRRDRTCLYDLVHLNTTGSERVAETVAAALAGLPELTSRAHRGPPTEPAPR